MSYRAGAPASTSNDSGRTCNCSTRYALTLCTQIFTNRLSSRKQIMMERRRLLRYRLTHSFLPNSTFSSTQKVLPVKGKRRIMKVQTQAPHGSLKVLGRDGKLTRVSTLVTTLITTREMKRRMIQDQSIASLLKGRPFRSLRKPLRSWRNGTT